MKRNSSFEDKLHGSVLIINCFQLESERSAIRIKCGMYSTSILGYLGIHRDFERGHHSLYQEKGIAPTTNYFLVPMNAPI
jgi:hypothetical protein